MSISNGKRKVNLNTGVCKWGFLFLSSRFCNNDTGRNCRNACREHSSLFCNRTMWVDWQFLRFSKNLGWFTPSFADGHALVGRKCQALSSVSPSTSPPPQPHINPDERKFLAISSHWGTIKAPNETFLSNGDLLSCGLTFATNQPWGNKLSAWCMCILPARNKSLLIDSKQQAIMANQSI